MVKKILILCGVMVMLSACSCPRAFKMLTIQKSDKGLSCKDITLEINEAEFYRDAAQRTEASVFSPMCIASTQKSAREALLAAEERIAYLERIAELMGCYRRREPAPFPPVRSTLPPGARPLPQGYIPRKAPTRTAPPAALPPGVIKQRLPSESSK